MPVKIGLEWQLHLAFLKLPLVLSKLSFGKQYGKCKVTPVSRLTCHPKAECWALLGDFNLGDWFGYPEFLLVYLAIFKNAKTALIGILCYK